jgi:S-DNA-T family DNA segregation ATPase FtsK/SpoIIIE
MKWLPHVRRGDLAGNAAEANAVVARLEELIDARLAGGRSDDEAVELPVTLVFVHDTAPIDRARLVQIAERGPAAGIFVAWYAASVERLPAACRTFVELDANTGRGRAGFVQGGVAVTDLEPEPVGAAAMGRMARLLSPLVDCGAIADDESDLPRSVALVDLAGHELATDASAVTDLWRESQSVPTPRAPRRKHDGGLRALVGQTVDGPLHLDLRTQGPHALVGGTTGSGKSEFLQSWILGMAAMNSPARVTFLLVDYKGGAAFADCVDLPHCVGLVTDLSPHLVRRALTSLDAELRYREQLLHDRQAKDLLELERRNDPLCPPSLVIVVDEFAALVSEVPEFVDGVVNVAQRGRSLGLHLVLATQRPAGVIKDNLRANTNLRIALRMADEDDSVDVIGTDQAALFDPATPGRAIVKSGPGRVTSFQSAYSGGHSTGTVASTPIEIRELRFGAGEIWVEPADAPQSQSGPTDIQRIVATITDAAGELGVPAPRRPWLPELAERYRLEALPTDRTDRALVFGVIDDPDAQAQPDVAFRPDTDGNMVVFGTGGAGKSAFLRSIAVAAGFAPARGGPCWVYGLDFGTRGLQVLERLPHVGSIIPGDDAERVQRLLRFVKDAIDERAGRYAQANASTIHEYRERSGRADEPRIIVLVDGAGAFRSEYEGGVGTRWWDLFQSIAADGRGVGVHVVISADRPTAISSGLASTIQRQLVLRLANDMDYALVDAPADAFGPGTPAGRGFIGGREVQVAVIGGNADVASQAAEIDRLASSMERAEVPPALPIRSLPDRVALSELPDRVGELPVLGVWDETLDAVGFAPTGTFLVAGAPHAGTSTTVATIVRSLAAAQPDSEFVLFGQRRSPLTNIVSWGASAHGESEIAQLAERLATRLASVRGDRVVVVIEAIGDLLNTEADLPLQELIRACRDTDAFVVAEGETSGLTGSWPLLQAVKINRSGIVLQPDQMDGDTMFKTPFPRTTRAEFPAGRGLMVQGGHVRKVQVALPE